MTTLFAAPALPLETMEEIIDLLVRDKSSLLQCSLVSTAWRSRALHHLLCYVSLHRQSKIDALAALLAANSTLAMHLREVFFHSHTPSLSLLPKLWNVEIVRMAHLRFNCQATFDSFMALAGATFPRLPCLVLMNSVFCSCPSDVSTSLIKAFPHLNQLLLAYNTYSSSTIPFGHRSFIAGTLRTLKLFDEDIAVLDCFADPRWHAPPLLEELEYRQRRVCAWRGDVNDIDEHYAVYADGLSNLLNAATSLRHLNIAADSTEASQEIETLLKCVTRRVDFATHGALRTFMLECDTTPLALHALVGVIRAIRRPMSMDAITLSISGIEYSFWLQVVDAMRPSPSPDEHPVELVLKFRRAVCMITSLAMLEGVLGELTRA